ncbi:MAG: hypothetical protein UR89_C0022G0011 [Candidatus Roizmanbacteria bacterium GW2011_GWA2_35_8]|uniref:Uncharacterized protein n=1 Tax=Candidatus Roizmanbacteria bacterium GW2011_GWA2_35_8 TaxID=1618479 RepID=A0A0G0DCQ3_9BACT|nr:MAG: hypothetical protein UR89_C0022G0011 [Candidatus Roizmanbacteria bacterium GW2011_GWA2_35_8]
MGKHYLACCDNKYESTGTQTPNQPRLSRDCLEALDTIIDTKKLLP